MTHSLSIYFHEIMSIVTMAIILMMFFVSIPIAVWSTIVVPLSDGLVRTFHRQGHI